MFEAFLANTSTQGLSPLGTAPQRSFELITGTVRDKLGERHAALFAEPVATQYGDRFDWYATTAGEPRQLDSFDEEVRAEIEADFQSLLSDITEYGQSLLDSKDPDQQRLGEALCNAVKHPGPDCVYVLEDRDAKQPVMLNWAWVSDNQAAVTGDLSGAEGAARAQKKAAARAAATAATAARPTVQDEAPAAVATADRGPLNLWWLMWFGWLLLLMMIAAIWYLMVEACALRLPGVESYCPPPAAEASEQERRTLWLRDRIASLERQIGIADRACQPEKVLAPIPDPKDRTEAAPDVDSNRLTERGAREGELTISLLWDSIADLHMDVRCPGSQIINYDNRSACGGTLDIGGNHDITTAVPNAIESMYFDAPADGTYFISISLFHPHGQSTTQPFRLRVKEGSKIKTFTGSVSQNQPAWTAIYEVGKGN